MLEKYARVPPGNVLKEMEATPHQRNQGQKTGKRRINQSCVDSDNKERPREQQCDPVCSGARFKIARAFSL